MVTFTNNDNIEGGINLFEPSWPGTSNGGGGGHNGGGGGSGGNGHQYRSWRKGELRINA